MLELRSLFLGGGADVQPSRSDGTPGSGLERFSPSGFGSRSFVDLDDGSADALVRNAE